LIIVIFLLSIESSYLLKAVILPPTAAVEVVFTITIAVFINLYVSRAAVTAAKPKHITPY